MYTVTILGSGFSHELGRHTGADIPLTRDFLRQAFDLVGGHDAFPNLRQFIPLIYKQRPDIDIETLYDMLDIAVQSKEYLWIKDEGRCENIPHEPEPLRREIVYLVFHFLRILTRGNNPDVNGLNDEILGICPKILSREPSNAILSLNWDTIVDMISLYRHGNEPFKVIYTKHYGSHINYGFVPDYENLKFSPQQGHGESPCLLKLHGSLNWYSCRDNNHIHVFDPLKFFSDPEGYEYRCEKDGSKLDPLLLPPSASKNYAQFPFQKIWRRAFFELQKAEKIVLFGCSIRDADFRLKDLLIKSYISRSVSSEPEVLIISDKNGAGEVEEKIKKIGYKKISQILSDSYVKESLSL